MNFNLTVSRPLPLILNFAENEGEIRSLGWMLPPEELVNVPEHWLSYEDINPYYHIGLVFIWIFLMVFSLIGNGLVLWIFCLAKPLRTPSNIFVVNLAFCDFLSLTKAPTFIYDTLFVGYMEHTSCQFFAVLGAISGIGASTTNAIIAYDRYNTIARPFDGRMSYGKAIFLVFCTWCYMVPWIYFPLTGKWSRYVPEGYLTTCTFDYLTPTDEIKKFVATIFFFCYCVPMTFIVYYYSQIVTHVFRHEKALRDQAKKMNVDSLRSNQDANAQSAEVRIAKAAITICFLFVAAWTPYATVALIGAFGDRSLLTPGVTMIPATFCKSVACFDPYVYAISHPKYRMELAKRIPCLGIKEAPPVVSETQSATTTTA
ncbi:opsin, ultraviolet-sensitive [Daktulosphaira vitifoliae]|uniref:opsin, ultraviolet-sensitive n=1 Tax=Daktulosphaira vitifoliae TaxID=58002 RepID=UPI0021AA482B|nr:opsin, ultraviolet-sensitive [Daktulosphaira vitifoliae]